VFSRGTNLDHNLLPVEALRAIAQGRDATVAHVAIAWVLSRGQDIIPLVGARRRDRLADALGALHLKLTTDDFKRIEHAIPFGAVAGERYAPQVLMHMDSARQSKN
jgi:aryl-alcohol dehydrogenase-like predicted oxidoreductase